MASAYKLARVPAVYLGSAFLAFLWDLSECGMNNLRRFNSTDGSIPPAGTGSFNYLTRSACFRSCTMGAQRFDLFHRFSRSLRHFLDVVLLRDDHAGVPQQALGGHCIFLHRIDQRCDPSTNAYHPCHFRPAARSIGRTILLARLSRLSGFPA